MRAFGGLTQMKWGPADCSATLGGHPAYSFSVILWSRFQVANLRSLLQLFPKRCEEEREGEAELHLPERCWGLSSTLPLAPESL